MENDDIQRDKFDLQEGDIEWITKPGEPSWVYPTGSLSEVLDFMGVPEEYRRERTRVLMSLPSWREAPRNIKLEATRLVDGDGR